MCFRGLKHFGWRLTFELPAALVAAVGLAALALLRDNTDDSSSGSGDNRNGDPTSFKVQATTVAAIPTPTPTPPPSPPMRSPRPPALTASASPGLPPPPETLKRCSSRRLDSARAHVDSAAAADGSLLNALRLPYVGSMACAYCLIKPMRSTLTFWLPYYMQVI